MAEGSGRLAGYATATIGCAPAEHETHYGAGALRFCGRQPIDKRADRKLRVFYGGLEVDIIRSVPQLADVPRTVNTP